MFKTQFTLALLALYAGMAHSFSWEIVVAAGNRLEFYDNQGTLTYTKNTTASAYFLTYDPVHERVLFVDYDDDTFQSSIYTFDLTTKIIEYLPINTTNISSFTYDPATELLFWTENLRHTYSISLKPASNNTINENQLILVVYSSYIYEIAVDSCRGFIYWLTGNDHSLCRARFNGSEKEVIIGNISDYGSFTMDQQTQTVYWFTNGGVECADLNGNNIRRISEESHGMRRQLLTAAKDVLYYRTSYEYESKSYIRTIPKNPLRDIHVESKLFIEHDEYISSIATNLNIEDLTRGLQNCEALKSLLPNKSVTNANDSLKVSTDESLLCVHGTKVSGADRCECTQGYSGERCDVSVCQNYCFQGDCNAGAEGQPKCSCNAGYSGERCEINVCQRYCLNDGVCSLAETSEPVCQCTGDFEGERCEVPGFLSKCIQTFSMLRNIINTDVTPLNLGRRVKSTCTIV